MKANGTKARNGRMIPYIEGDGSDIPFIDPVTEELFKSLRALQIILQRFCLITGRDEDEDGKARVREGIEAAIDRLTAYAVESLKDKTRLMCEERMLVVNDH